MPGVVQTVCLASIDDQHPPRPELLPRAQGTGRANMSPDGSCPATELLGVFAMSLIEGVIAAFGVWGLLALISFYGLAV